MPSVLYGGGILNARGSIGGQTHTRNRAGALIKSRIKGVNPATPFQTKARAIVGHINNVWKYTLVDSDRAAWSAFAAANPVLNAFGQTTTLSGFQWFTKLNAKTYASNFFTQTLPPASTAISTPLTVSLALVSGVGGTISVTYTSNGVASPEIMQMWISPPMSRGRSFVSSQLKLTSGHGVDGTYDITTDYKQRFGKVPTGVGMKTFCRIQVVNTQTGITSPALQTSGLWT